MVYLSRLERSVFAMDFSKSATFTCSGLLRFGLSTAIAGAAGFVLSVLSSSCVLCFCSTILSPQHTSLLSSSLLPSTSSPSELSSSLLFLRQLSSSSGVRLGPPLRLFWALRLSYCLPPGAKAFYMQLVQ